MREKKNRGKSSDEDEENGEGGMSTWREEITRSCIFNEDDDEGWDEGRVNL